MILLYSYLRLIMIIISTFIETHSHVLPYPAGLPVMLIVSQKWGSLGFLMILSSYVSMGCV
jgi:hypothetical protein